MNVKLFYTCRVKPGIFGQTAKFGQRPCLFHISNIVIKNKLTKQTVKILKRRFIWIYTVCECVSEFTRCPNLPDFPYLLSSFRPYLGIFAVLCYNMSIASQKPVSRSAQQIGSVPQRHWNMHIVALQIIFSK